MNVLLIYPHWPDTYWSFRYALSFQGKRAAYPPLGLLTVAAMLPAHWNKRLVDSNVRNLTDADLRWADTAFVSGMLVHEQEALQILARCREAGLRTVVGGPIASSVDLREHADHVVVGEAEDLMPQLIADLEAGRPKLLLRSRHPAMKKTPRPDLSLINPRHYSTMAVQYSRAVHFNVSSATLLRSTDAFRALNPSTR